MQRNASLSSTLSLAGASLYAEIDFSCGDEDSFAMREEWSVDLDGEGENFFDSLDAHVDGLTEGVLEVAKPDDAFIRCDHAWDTRGSRLLAPRRR